MQTQERKWARWIPSQNLLINIHYVRFLNQGKKYVTHIYPSECKNLLWPLPQQISRPALDYGKILQRPTIQNWQNQEITALIHQKV